MVKGENCDMHPHTYIDKLIAFHIKVFTGGIYPEAGSNTLLEEKMGGSRGGSSDLGQGEARQSVPETVLP